MPRPLLDLSRLSASWLLELRAAGKSTETLRAYRISVESFLADYDELTKPNVIAWLAALPGEPASIRLRLAGLKQFARWLSTEEDFDADSILLIKPPPLAQKPVPALTDDQIEKLLKVCGGKDWRSRRDRAIITILAECGLRRGELLALDAEDVNKTERTILVRKAKGNKSRKVRFSDAAAVALDRYQRSASAYTGPLWRGNKGDRLSASGLTFAMEQRGAQAGVKFHVHQLRHSMATRWRARGGSETGLMAFGGWSDLTMVARYSAHAKQELAVAEFDRINMRVG
jgi:integrase/recombinase XerD